MDSEDSEDEYDRARKEDRLRDEEEDANISMHYAFLDEEEEKKKKAEEERRLKQEEDYIVASLESHGLNEGKEAEEERMCKEEAAHNEWLRESRLRDEEQKKKVERGLSSLPPSICNSCVKRPAQFKLTTVQFRSGCTCKDPHCHVGQVTNLCSFECSYWDVSDEYTTGGVSFVVMSGLDECNVCGQPMASSTTDRLEVLHAGSTVTSSSTGIQW